MDNVLRNCFEKGLSLFHQLAWHTSSLAQKGFSFYSNSPSLFLLSLSRFFPHRFGDPWLKMPYLWELLLITLYFSISRGTVGRRLEGMDYIVKN